MKKPIRSLCTVIGGLRLPKLGLARLCPMIAAGGLCATAALVFVRTAGSPGRDSVKQTAAAPSSREKTSSTQPQNRIQTSDPARALAHAFTLGDRSERNNLVRALLCEWAARDAEAALDWVASLEDPAARRSARSTVCLAVAENDPQRAVTLALAHDADQGNDGGLLECLTMQWCEKECATVVDWASEQPPGEWRDRLLASASFVLSKSDPAKAAHLVSGLEPGTVQDEAAMAVLHQWALKDASAALRWAEAFPATPLRERALVEISNLRDLAASHAVE